MRGPPLRRLWLVLLPLLLPVPPAARAAAAAAGAAHDDGVCARLRPGALDPRDQAAVDRLAAAVAERFGAAEVAAAPAELAAAEALLACHKALTQLFALASPGSALADGVAKALLRRGAPGAALAFLSARSPAAVPYAALVAARPALLARWAGAVFEAAVGGGLRPGVAARLRAHAEWYARRFAELVPPGAVAAGPHLRAPFALSAYVAADGERNAVRRAVNAWVRAAPPAPPAAAAKPAPAPPEQARVLVVSAFWYPWDVSVRTSLRYLRGVQERFATDLLFLGDATRPGAEPLAAGFRRLVRPRLLDAEDCAHAGCVRTDGGRFLDAADLMAWVVAEAYDVVLYPQPGFDTATLVLANHRLAPVQVGTYGQPASTEGALLDYWLAGEAAEPPDLAAARGRSERLVLLPGLGVLHKWPGEVFPAAPAPSPPRGALADPAAEAVVVASAAPFKLHAAFVEALRAVRRGHGGLGGGPLRLRLLSKVGGPGHLQRRLLERELGGALPGWRVEVVDAPAAEYLGVLGTGHVFLDSFPFGGCNTVLDAMYMGVVPVAVRGRSWHSRVGAATLDLVGLGELAVDAGGGPEAVAEAVLGALRSEPLRRKARLLLARPRLRAVVQEVAAAREGDWGHALADLVANHARYRAEDPPYVAPFPCWAYRHLRCRGAPTNTSTTAAAA